MFNLCITWNLCKTNKCTGIFLQKCPEIFLNICVTSQSLIDCAWVPLLLNVHVVCTLPCAMLPTCQFSLSADFVYHINVDKQMSFNFDLCLTYFKNWGSLVAPGNTELYI